MACTPSVGASRRRLRRNDHPLPHRPRRGGELQSCAQNLDTSGGERQVGRKWSTVATEHTVAVARPRTREGTKRKREMIPHESMAVVAGLLTFMVAFAPDAAGRRRRRLQCDAESEKLCRSSARARARSTSIAWAGYVEDGSTDPKVDWVDHFEEKPDARSRQGRPASDECQRPHGSVRRVSASRDATTR